MREQDQIPVLLVQYDPTPKENQSFRAVALRHAKMHPMVIQTIFKMGGLNNMDTEKCPIPVSMDDSKDTFAIGDIWIRTNYNPQLIVGEYLN